MKESEYLDLMNGLDTRYTDETVNRLSGNTGFEAVPLTDTAPNRRRKLRITAGLLAAGAAAVCALAVTVMLQGHRQEPEMITPAAKQTGSDFVLVTQQNTGETPVSLGTAEERVETTNRTNDNNTVTITETTTRAAGIHTDNSLESVVESTTKISSAASGVETVTGITSVTKAAAAVTFEQDARGYFRLAVPADYQGTVGIQSEEDTATALTASQSAHLLKLMADEKLERLGESVIPSGRSVDKYLDSHLAVELNGTDIRWDIYNFKVAALDIVKINGEYYQGKTADALKQIRQYADYCLHPDREYYTIHLPAGFTGQALVSTIVCSSNPVVLSNEDTGFILKKMIEAKLYEIPTPELPCGGPITVELDGAGIRWDIYTTEIVSIDGKFYRDSNGSLADLELYALGFLGGERPE